MNAVPSKLAAALAFALPLAAASWAVAQDKPQDKPSTPPAAAAPAKAGSLRGDLLAELDEARDKLIQLAEAMPADKYGWRPGPGVRSVGEVFAHVAGGNVFLARSWGAAPPDLGGIDLRALQTDANDKAKVVTALKKSFEHADKAIADIPEDGFDREIDLFGSKRSVRAAVLVTVAHAHEHLGQAIAYARTNGVTPPWSAAEGQQGGR